MRALCVGDRGLKTVVVCLRADERILQCDHGGSPACRSRCMSESGGVATDGVCALRRPLARATPLTAQAPTSLADDQNFEAVGDVARPRPEPVCGARLAVGRNSLWVFSSTAIVRAPTSVATFSTTSYWRRLLNHRQRAFAVRAVGEAGARIERDAIRPSANRR